MYFNPNQVAAELSGLPSSAAGAGSQSTSALDTNVQLLLSGDLAHKTALAVGHGVTPRQIAGAIGVTPLGDTTIVVVAATWTSAKGAATIANDYASIFANEQNNANHSQFVAALKVTEKQLSKLTTTVEQQSAQGVSLASRLSTLEGLVELKSTAVQVSSTAGIPNSTSSPKTKTNVLLGAIFGLLLGFGVVFLLERLDQRVRDPADLEAIYGLPLLGVVPESTALARSGRERGAAVGLPPREAEIFHLIRAHLRYFEVDRDLQTLLVSSAASEDGKTTIARCLAVAAAQMGSRVLLLEADLRRPRLATQFGLPPGPGLADVLIGAVPLSEATQLVDPDPPGREVSLGRPLAVLVAGADPPPNPGELLESLAMERVLEQSRVAYDLVVVDTAPLSLVSDSFPLLRKVDGVIIVGRLGRTRRDVAQGLRQTLAGGGSPLLGVIANGYKARRKPPLGYSYDYSDSRVSTPTLR